MSRSNKEPVSGVVNTLLSEQYGCQFADNIFKYILLKEEFCILIQKSPDCPINNESALF